MKSSVFKIRTLSVFSVDNVLLSEDGKNTFLCDFGESERLDPYGFSPSQGKDFNNN